MSAQVMNEQTLCEWLESAINRRVTDVFQTTTPNTFYVSFNERLYSDEVHQLQALGLWLRDTPIARRYFVKYIPSEDDELDNEEPSC